MQVIGITGSSGSGKTTICEILNQRKDTKIINADQMAKDLTNSETDYFEEIKIAFQKENILLENGDLNRARLADLIYHNKENLEKLNQITFKHLIPKIRSEIENVTNEIRMVIIDAPLLFEAGLEEICDLTIAVEAPEELKIERICRRDNISEEVAKARLEIQKSNEFYAEKADFIIMNYQEMTLEQLQEEINQIIERTKK